ncbi:MAG TPA: non-homologous end-joining DNA ligase, partial [Parachlamydiaceae bacterium]|nr:non-homologous end-joining DNA ligase [Parachlamydiaceae bacterium]
MSLKEYKAKRDFKKTQEPATANKKNVTESLNFCIQKHAARALHYDFRLECRGVLISWAVPKGPSLNPEDKRLAIKVEDHPLDYQYFEGVIPKGNYGAGTVEIWDSGTYTMVHTFQRKEIEKELLEKLDKGHFAIILQGEKLNGEFVFQKLKKDPDDNAWLLIKKADAFEDETTDIVKTAKKKVKSKMPDFVPPMLATLIDEPFDNEDWLFEVKWDGFRALTSVNKGVVEIQSRNKLLFNTKFPSIVDDLKKIQGNVIFDGEIVVLDSKGKSHFQLMQNYKNNSKGTTLCYYVFDILYKDGEDLRNLPLIERKEILKKYISQLSLPSVQYSDHVLKDGKNFFKAAAKEELEGVIGKKISGIYQSRRSPDWVKIKTSQRQEVVICGFTEPKGSRKKFGALIAGVYDNNKKLIYAGHVGGGFDGALLDDIYKQLQPLITKKCPFEHTPKVNTPVTWVKPKLIGEVSFAEWTKDNIMRQPIFQGLRDDKNPATVKHETPQPAPESVKSKTKSTIKTIKDLTLTNLDKV